MIFYYNTPPKIRGEVARILGMREANHLAKYLGLPSTIGRNKINLFSYIKE